MALQEGKSNPVAKEIAFFPFICFSAVFFSFTSLLPPFSHAGCCSREESSEAALELLHHLFLSSLFKLSDQDLGTPVVFLQRWGYWGLSCCGSGALLLICLPFLSVNYSSVETAICQHKLHKKEQGLLEVWVKIKFMYLFKVCTKVSYIIFYVPWKKGLGFV